MEYEYSDEYHNTMAAKEIIPVILNFCKPNSILDAGCGLGTWLQVFLEDYKIKDILGIDRFRPDYKQLYISHEYYKTSDLRNGFDLGRKFDLLLCLEVAEHLPEQSSDKLIHSLCSHSDDIVFSAAIPGQGGQNHYNEQWPEYWEKKFKSHGFKKNDCIRQYIWDNTDIEIWYRQNMYFYSKRSIDGLASNTDFSPIVHPDYWTKKIAKIADLQSEIDGFNLGEAGIKRSFSAFLNSIKNKLKK